MTKIQKILIVVVVAIALVLIGWVAHKPSSSPAMVGAVAGQGVPSGFDNVSLTGILQVGVNPNGNLNAIPTQFATGTVYAQGDLIQGGLCSVSSVVSTTTLNLTAANLECSTLSITNSSSSALTVNLPASSTLTYLANAGDETDTYIYSASTTGANITIANGTGFTLNSSLTTASSTAATTTITAGTLGYIASVRLPTTNLIGLMLP
jgi:hypothetical protein